ncbi:MAG: Maf family nucleotide pyrophosphatase, partial [Chitinophagia bacterium]
MPSFILASQSPRRKTLLEWAEIPFEIIVSDTDESYPASIAIETVPEFIAKNKALAVKDIILSTKPALVNWCIIAADTVVLLDQKIIGKPSNRAQAIESLLALSGQIHKVITGVVLLYQGQEISFSETTLVEFHTLTMEQIEFYVDKYQPYDKAGGYAIQEWIGVVG